MSINLLASAARFATQMLPTVARAARTVAQVAPQALPRMGQRLSSSMSGLASRPMLGQVFQKLMEQAVDAGLHAFSGPNGSGSRPSHPWTSGRPPGHGYGPMPGATPPSGGSTPHGFGGAHGTARPHPPGADPWSRFRQGFKEEFSTQGPPPQAFGANSWSGVGRKAGQHFAQGFRQGAARAEAERRSQHVPPPADPPAASAPPGGEVPPQARPRPEPRPQAQGRSQQVPPRGGQQGPRRAEQAPPPAADAPSESTLAALASMGLPADAEAHQILGVSRSATPQEIRTAYKRQQMKYHPDRNRDNPHATTASQLISKAYTEMQTPAAET